MQCPDCGADNREDRRFCAQCGASLSVSCPQCGFANEPGEKFCGGCGAAQTGGAAPSDAAPAGELRQVTVLFVDLSGFTAMSSRLDPEETHAVLGRFFEIADGVVEKFGGSVDKHIGDNVMAVFGAPVAHDDDPERAVRAAVDIHAAMPDLSAEAGHDLSVHIGIASGQVMASGTGSSRYEEYTVTGETVNLASRLDDMAKAGQTLISNAVYGAVSDLVVAESAGEVMIKGLDAPVRVWRMTALEGPASAPHRGLLVGRRAEIGQFTGIVEACRDGAGGQAVFLRGEAGIGKTRLVEEFTAIAAARSFAGHMGLFFDFGVGKGQDAIGALVRSLLGIAPGSPKEMRQDAAERMMADGRLSQERRPFLYDFLDLPQPAESRAMYDAMDNAVRIQGKQELVSELIAVVSGDQPILVVVEDVHWAGPLALGYVGALTAGIGDCPAVLLMTSRIEGDPLDQAWRATACGTPLITMDIGPLRKREALDLAETYMKSTDQLAADCVERAEGNPLFLEQLLRNAGESQEETVPTSIQSLVLARMDRLPDEDRRALQAASVLGQNFSLDVLRHLSGNSTYDCAGLIAHSLVRPTGGTFLFVHALVQEGVYGSLLKANRRDLHKSAAGWFADRDPGLHAEHLDRAKDPAAADAYRRAAEIQSSEFRFERALQLFERGCELAVEQSAKFGLTCFRADIQRDLGSIEDSIDAFHTALQAAGDDTERCRAWIGMAAGMRITDKYDDALAALDKAEAAAAGHGLTAELAQIHYLRGNIYFPLGDIDGCLKHHQLALGFAQQVGSAKYEARALSGLGDAYYLRGRMITAHDHFERCIALCRANGFGRIEVANTYMRGTTNLYQNNLQAALEDCLASAETAVLVGDLRAEMVARGGVLGYLLIEMGDMEGAVEQLERARSIVLRLGARRFDPFNMLNLGKILVAKGRRAEAVKLLEEALEISRDTGITFLGPWVLGVLALATEDPVVRAKALAEAEEILEQDCVAHNYFWFYRDAMEVSLDDGAWDDVLRYAAALADYTSAEPLPWCDFFIGRGRGLAAWGSGDHGKEAEAELGRLREEAAGFGLEAALPALDAALAETGGVTP